MELTRHIGLKWSLSPLDVLRLLKAFANLALLLYFLLSIKILIHILSIILLAFPEAKLRVIIGLENIFWSLVTSFLVCTSEALQIALLMQKYSKFEILVAGDKMDSESAIIIANHASLVDHVVLAHLAQHETDDTMTKPRVAFFTWFSLWSLPSTRAIRNMAKLDENWELSPNAGVQIFQAVLNSSVNDWIILFPEVNIFNSENKSRQEYLGKKYFLPKLHYLLYPRTLSVFSLSSALYGDYKFNKMYDVTICYFSRSGDSTVSLFNPTLLDLFAAKSETLVSVHVKQRSIKKLKYKRPRLERWLEKVWLEKDAIVQVNVDSKLTLPG